MLQEELSAARAALGNRAQHAMQLEEGHKRRTTFVDSEIAKTAGNPGPGTHKPKMNPITGLFGKFGEQNPPSNLDLVIMNAEKLPGAADYAPQTTCFGASGSAVPNVRFGDNISKSSLDWVIHRAKQVMRASKLYETISHAWFVFLNGG